MSRFFFPSNRRSLGKTSFAKNFLSGKSNFDLGVLSCSIPPPPSSARPTSLTLLLYVSVELPEPYHSLPIKQWRKVMRANRKSYATDGVRAWLRGHHKIRLQQPPFSIVA